MKLAQRIHFLRRSLHWIGRAVKAKTWGWVGISLKIARRQFFHAFGRGF